MSSNYFYTITQNLNDDHHHSPAAPFRNFLIKLDFRYITSLDRNTTLAMFQRQITCSKTLIFSDQSGPKMIQTLFSGTGSPEVFVQRVYSDLISLVKEIDSDPVNSEMVGIEIKVDVEETEHVGFVAASKSAIEGLERVKLGEVGDFALPIKKRRGGLVRSEECSICMEEFQVRSEEEVVVRMPCRHFYHESCIVRWLEKSRFCPLCRYPMPC